MSTPECLELYYVFHLGLQELVQIIFLLEVSCAHTRKLVLLSVIEPLQRHRLTIHVELGLIAVFTHATITVCGTVSHDANSKLLFLIK